MKLIMAFVRTRMRDRIVEQLQAMEVPGASLSTIEGFGYEAEDGTGERSYEEDVTPYTRKLQIEIVCSDERVEPIVNAIADRAHTGRRGDGKIFVLPIEAAVDIRSGRRGNAVL